MNGHAESGSVNKPAVARPEVFRYTFRSGTLRRDERRVSGKGPERILEEKGREPCPPAPLTNEMETERRAPEKTVPPADAILGDGGPLTANSLKVVAMALMFVDHFAVVFLPPDSILRAALRFFGRIVAPVICFLIAEGYRHTSNRRRYVTRLLVFAAISHVPFNLAFGYPLLPSAGRIFPPTGVIWALAMGLVALGAVKSERLHVALKPVAVLACCAAAYTANWNFVAVLWIVAFGVFGGNPGRRILAFHAVGIVCYLLPAFLRFALSEDGLPPFYQTGIFLFVPFLAMYNGRLGKKSKATAMFFYVFYPAHLLLLFVLAKITGAGLL